MRKIGIISCCIRLLLGISLLVSSVPAWSTTTSTTCSSSIFTSSHIGGVSALQHGPNGLSTIRSATSRKRLHHRVFTRRNNNNALLNSASSIEGDGDGSSEAENNNQGEDDTETTSVNESNEHRSGGNLLDRLRGGMSLAKHLPPENERKKMVPLAIMFFCILFNYTILRSTKDVLVRNTYVMLAVDTVHASLLYTVCPQSSQTLLNPDSRNLCSLALVCSHTTLNLNTFATFC